ncbi:MAG: dUTPase [Erysipelotrichia bacterium]|nr:dUTPase [Erysipelotrichia bacterium]
MTIDLSNLYQKQSELDEFIARNHDINYDNTRDKRILALLVELGEFANVTRCFKYWSIKKSESEATVLDEYVDGLHFFLSLGLDIGVLKKVYRFAKEADTLTAQILKTYRLVSNFNKERDERSYRAAFQAFINIAPLLKVSWETIEKAYLKKLEINFTRQNNNY